MNILELHWVFGSDLAQVSGIVEPGSGITTMNIEMFPLVGDVEKFSSSVQSTSDGVAKFLGEPSFLAEKIAELQKVVADIASARKDMAQERADFDAEIAAKKALK